MRGRDRGFPGGASGKEPAASARDGSGVVLIPGSRRSLEEDVATDSRIFARKPHRQRRAWQATVHGVSESQTQLSTRACPLVLGGHLSLKGEPGRLQSTGPQRVRHS